MNDHFTSYRPLMLLLLIATLFAPACDRGGSTAVDGATSTPPAEVRLGYFANVTHGQAVLGVASGELAAAVAPAKLTTRVFNAGPALIEALFAGEIDVAYVGPGPAISAYSKSRGQGIRIISGAAANGVVIVARSDASINSLADLAGKRIATPQIGNTQDISAKHYLSAELKATDLSNVIAVPNAEQSTMLARGELDAAWVPEPWGAKLIAEGGKLIAEEKNLWPEKRFALTVVAASPEFLKAHPQTVTQILSVHRNWTRKLSADSASHAAKLGDAIFELTGKRVATEVIAASLPRVEFTTDPLPQTLTAMAKWTHELGFSRDPISTEGLVDLSLLDALPPDR